MKKETNTWKFLSIIVLVVAIFFTAEIAMSAKKPAHWPKTVSIGSGTGTTYYAIAGGMGKMMEKHLGVEPGSVSLLAVANDAANTVAVFIDSELWASGAFQFHPLVNTATLVIPKEGIIRFLDATGHVSTIIEVPE